MADQSLMVGSFMVGRVERFFIVRRHTETWLTEEQMRTRLAGEGLAGEAIDHQLARARAMREWAAKHYVDRLTDVGYRNEQAQTVVRKTDEPGRAPFQRVFILRCDRCGHEYGCDGCDIPRQRCPICQRH
jgi:hypothetical protein